MIFMADTEHVILLRAMTEAEFWRFSSDFSGVIHMAKEMRLSGISLL
jgi:hypothetical protein